MIKIQEFQQLKTYNSLAISAIARYFIEITSKAELQELLKAPIFKSTPYLILGGGNNVLFSKDFDGLVIFMNNKGMSITKKSENSISINACAGEDWDNFVAYTTDNNFGGLENLSLIPGTVGASPVQNIGAYGVEVKDSIMEVHTISLKNGKTEIFSNDECQFAYRSSIFKSKKYKNHIITNVIFKLTQKNHKFKTHYGTIETELQKYNKIDLQVIRQAIINIRESKLPDPSKIPNAGSFFKNPVIDHESYSKLIQKFPDAVVYNLKNNTYKVAAGWLIDKAGWKGKMLEKVGVHSQQALVLINHNNGNGQDIIDLATQIQKSVYQKFSLKINMEVSRV